LLSYAKKSKLMGAFVDQIKGVTMAKVIKYFVLIVIFIISAFSIYHVINSRKIDEHSAD